MKNSAFHRFRTYIWVDKKLLVCVDHVCRCFTDLGQYNAGLAMKSLLKEETGTGTVCRQGERTYLYCVCLVIKH